MSRALWSSGTRPTRIRTKQQSTNESTTRSVDCRISPSGTNAPKFTRDRLSRKYSANRASHNPQLYFSIKNFLLIQSIESEVLREQSFVFFPWQWTQSNSTRTHHTVDVVKHRYNSCILHHNAQTWNE